ncbi:hypothetical protein [Nocardioides sp. R-C-SC26]|uniref:DUF6907 domain-containing protein n=1 Tax=Nocardioides sp. R-C-SC26 TaxID=2870414 RepID=UPI001E3A682C|nr:hypothetical protein [Nocardioides sp. R-C-SC26]
MGSLRQSPPPSWLDEPCPSWCARVHAEDDHPEDRIHRAPPVFVPGVLAQVDPDTLERVPEAGTLLVQRTQHLSDPTPWILVTETEDVGRQLLMSEQVARQLADALHDQSQE